MRSVHSSARVTLSPNTWHYYTPAPPHSPHQALYLYTEEKGTHPFYCFVFNVIFLAECVLYILTLYNAGCCFGVGWVFGQDVGYFCWGSMHKMYCV